MNPTRIKFKLALKDGEMEDLMTYAEVLQHIEDEEQSDPILWKFKSIVAHQGPLRPDHPDYNGSQWNVMVEWENGEKTFEPLNVIAADDPVTCAIYAKEKKLLEQPGWRRFRRLAGRTKKFIRAINQAKLRSYNNAPKYKYGFEVPRNYAHAIRLDTQNRSTKWKDAIALEMQQLDEYETFKDCQNKTPPGYKRISVHLVFDVKHDGRHKARCVADGHLTDIPLESVYSGVVTIRGVRMVTFLAELNDLELWQTDVGNAYLEAKTSEKLYIIAGPEFGPDRKGHTLVIHKALYGLRTSGKQWHIRFSECLRHMGFEACKAEPDIWMRPATNKHGEDVYEYIAVYVDDLMLAMIDPGGFVDELKEKYKFNFKGTGPITFHLGMDFCRDADGTLSMSPKRYIERMLSEYERHFGERPKHYVSPSIPGDHPETDTSELLGEDEITKFQSLIGTLQWCITIGRMDILTSIMSLSSFRAAPRKGHLERAKRVYGYLAKMKHGAIRIRTDEPDYSSLPTPIHGWANTVYGEPDEPIPDNAPRPRGKYVLLSHYMDANLMHDLLTGRSVTGILHFMNQTPIEWYSKKQATVEMATYGSKLVAARTATEQIIDIRNTLRYLGVPIRHTSYMFGDNKTVVDSSTIPHAKLNKRHTMLSFHRVREAMASGYLQFHHLPGSLNPADILSKHWNYQDVWTHLQPLMFWAGDVSTIATTT